MTAIITKIEAACRQLDTAIRLLFANEDKVAIHTLAVAAANLFADIAEYRNAGVSWRTHARDDSGLSMKSLKTVMHKEWNFFKHANNDPDGTLHFNEQISEDIMFMASLDCGDLHSSTCLIQAFQIWYIAVHPERFSEDEPIFADAMKVFPDLAGQSRSHQIQCGATFLREHCSDSF